MGVAIIARAIEEPMRWIATNAGHEGPIVVQRVRAMKDDEGFNAQTERYEDLVQAGVIDPTKVVRSALQNAASIASLLLTTETVIAQIPEALHRSRVRAAAWAACTDEARHREQATSRRRPSRRPEAPASCPFCQSFKVKTATEKVDASTYWRCETCGEMWNVGRLPAANHRRFKAR